MIHDILFSLQDSFAMVSAFVRPGLQLLRASNLPCHETIVLWDWGTGDAWLVLL